MWPRDAYVGQFVVGLRDVHCLETGDKLERGKVYTIARIAAYGSIVFFMLKEISNNLVRYDLVKPVDESRLEVFRAMLKTKGAWDHAENKNMDREDA